MLRCLEDYFILPALSSVYRIYPRLLSYCQISHRVISLLILLLTFHLQQLAVMMIISGADSMPIWSTLGMNFLYYKAPLDQNGTSINPSFPNQMTEKLP